MKENTCCFTGHRPSKLPWGYNESGTQFELFRERLKEVIVSSIQNGYTHFISGVALGFDIISAEIVLELKKIYKSITLECALPCINQSYRWSDEQKDRYNRVLSLADKITNVTNKYYFSGCMALRNDYMLNNSSLVIACTEDRFSGSGVTVSRAEELGLEVINVEV